MMTFKWCDQSELSKFRPCVHAGKVSRNQNGWRRSQRIFSLFIPPNSYGRHIKGPRITATKTFTVKEQKRNYRLRKSNLGATFQTKLESNIEIKYHSTH
ncbi:hypothetical protein RDWZM_006928 [Blomia tropicalis]|uniref:Uncharacterized protein n=1 Tax=Blomia tropicalis TaxID=40697 RepID=A0A9Q0M808_BLOTA|nr:hypothetical protein RDWZM_006928 [Blomia tropicalis]